jgi:putative ABC transport system ATP-binding protein
VDAPARDDHAVLEFRGISKSYASGREIVRAADDVSFRISAGELVALYGPSGSGKSTLLRIAAGVERPDAGSVLVDGVNVGEMSPKEAARYRMYVLGWISQVSDLSAAVSALDNAAMKQIVASGSLRRARSLVKPLLEELGLEERLAHPASALSVGERQRVMIARALSLNPRVILADEPTGSLDSRRSREVLGLLRDLTHERGSATLLVTHDEHAAAFADTVYTLLDGALSDAAVDRASIP